MNNITKALIKPLQESIYLRPYTMEYIQNGRRKTWELVGVHDSVAIVLYNPKRETLTFVKQFRPAVYYGSIPESDRISEIDVKKYPPELGITLELCAGIVDKKMSLKEIAKEEVLEECGYNVPLDSLEFIASYRSGVGTSGSIQTAYYCEIDESMKVTTGGGVDDEIIEVVELTIPETKEYLKKYPVASPPSFLFALYWFFYNKEKTLINKM